jgi:hypothetical protein
MVNQLVMEPSVGFARAVHGKYAQDPTVLTSKAADLDQAILHGMMGPARPPVPAFARGVWAVLRDVRIAPEPRGDRTDLDRRLGNTQPCADPRQPYRIRDFFRPGDGLTPGVSVVVVGLVATLTGHHPVAKAARRGRCVAWPHAWNSAHTASGSIRGLAGLELKDGWTLAERAGARSPDGMQRLLRIADRDVEGVRDDVRNYEMSELGDPRGVFVIDETRRWPRSFVGSWSDEGGEDGPVRPG